MLRSWRSSCSASRVRVPVWSASLTSSRMLSMAPVFLGFVVLVFDVCSMGFFWGFFGDFCWLYG